MENTDDSQRRVDKKHMAGLRRSHTAHTNINSTVKEIFAAVDIDSRCVQTYNERYDPLTGWKIAVVHNRESFMVICDESLGKIFVYH
tara:strand:- start:226 stop:486 length:261 start_codon:yes stop_codon:yes gene_type:complete